MDQVVGLYSDPPVFRSVDPYFQKIRLAEKLRGGVILEVLNAEQAQIAQNAGVVAITVFRRSITPMTDPSFVKELKRSVSIPIVARARVGHFLEALILDEMGVDYIDESEVLGITEDQDFINKHKFLSLSSPSFICGSQSLGETFRRIAEGAVMIRIQGDLNDCGNILKTVRNVRSVRADLRRLNTLRDDEVTAFSEKMEAPIDLVALAKKWRKFPVMLFAAGGIVTPADAALMMQLECDGVFVGPEIFGCPNPVKRIKAIVEAVRSHHDPQVLAEVSSGLCAPMPRFMVPNGNRTAQPPGV